MSSSWGASAVRSPLCPPAQSLAWHRTPGPVKERDIQEEMNTIFYLFRPGAEAALFCGASEQGQARGAACRRQLPTPNGGRPLEMKSGGSSEGGLPCWRPWGDSSGAGQTQLRMTITTFRN